MYLPHSHYLHKLAFIYIPSLILTPHCHAKRGSGISSYPNLRNVRQMLVCEADVVNAPQHYVYHLRNVGHSYPPEIWIAQVL